MLVEGLENENDRERECRGEVRFEKGDHLMQVIVVDVGGAGWDATTVREDHLAESFRLVDIRRRVQFDSMPWDDSFGECSFWSV